MKFRLEGNYGGFGLTKMVEAESWEDAWEQTGIYVDLEAAGWEIVHDECSEWEVVEL